MLAILRYSEGSAHLACRPDPSECLRMTTCGIRICISLATNHFLTNNFLYFPLTITSLSFIKSASGLRMIVTNWGCLLGVIDSISPSL